MAKITTSLDHRQEHYLKARKILDNLNSEQKYYLSGKNLSELAHLCFKPKHFNLTKKNNLQAIQAMVMGVNANYLTSLYYLPGRILTEHLGVFNEINMTKKHILNKDLLNKISLRKNGIFKPHFIEEIKKYEQEQTKLMTNKILVPNTKTTAEAIYEYQKDKSEKIQSLSKILSEQEIKIRLKELDIPNFDSSFPQGLLKYKEKTVKSIKNKLVNHFVNKGITDKLNEFEMNDFYGFSITLAEVIKPHNKKSYDQSKVKKVLNFLKKSKKINVIYDKKIDNQYLSDSRNILGLQMYLTPTNESGINFPFPKLVTDITDMKISFHLLDLMAEAQNTLGGYDAISHHIYKVESSKNQYENTPHELEKGSKTLLNILTFKDF